MLVTNYLLTVITLQVADLFGETHDPYRLPFREGNAEISWVPRARAQPPETKES